MYPSAYYATSSPTPPTSFSPTPPTTFRPTSNTPPNVLMLIADDFKPLMNTYGSPLVGKNPVYQGNLDMLARKGVAFMNAHSQMSFCGPSRASFMVSLRPDTLRIYELKANQLYTALKRFSNVGASGVAPLPQIFKQLGYNSYGIGKIFHENEFALMQSALLWNTPVFTWLSNYARPPSFTKPYQGSWIDFPTTSDTAFADGQAAQMAVGLLQTLSADTSTPFFLAVGLWKPHLPWRAPAKYLDTATNFNAAFGGGVTGGLSQAQYLLARGNGCGEVHAYAGSPSKLDASTASAATCAAGNRAYHATAVYMDTQMGIILNALYASSAANSTHVIFFGDHGFHLGDHGLYCKHTNYQQGTHVPLIFAPAQSVTSYARGKQSWAPVELLDVIPTIMDLTGLTSVATGSSTWEGVSLLPLLKNPTLYAKSAAIAQYFRGSGSNVKMGYSARTISYRQTRWCPFAGKLSSGRRRLTDARDLTTTTSSSSSVCFNECYDYIGDPWEQTSVGGTNGCGNNMGSLLTSFDALKGKSPWDWAQYSKMATAGATQQYP